MLERIPRQAVAHPQDVSEYRQGDFRRGLAAQVEADWRDDPRQRSIIQAADAAMRIHEGSMILYRCADDIDTAARANTEVCVRGG